MDTYIHYGHKAFQKELFQPIRNHPYMTKPYGGFWASNVDSKYGWEQWNQDNDFVSCKEEDSFCFTLKEDANVIHLYKEEDLAKLSREKYNPEFMLSSWYWIDFEKAIETGVDAIELHLSEGNHELYFPLYGWDCDSILIMNPDVIVEVKGEKYDNRRN